MNANTVQRVCVLGSTGSIGVNAIAVIEQNKDIFEPYGLVANRNVSLLFSQIRQLKPRFAIMADKQAAKTLRCKVKAEGLATEVLAGNDAVNQLAGSSDVDIVIAGIVGSSGLLPTLSAALSKKKILLANKEALVMAGHLFMQVIRESGATLLPIDSEHNAIFQCLPENHEAGLDELGVEKIILTASGGPLRTFPVESFATVTPKQACKHPNWSMGQKISVDSATMMNKGLELIEACWLFDAKPSHIEVVVHPQSIVHSMVAYKDGSVIAQMSNPDMRVPIAQALAWPKRIHSGAAALDLTKIVNLEFHPPDYQRFRCLSLAEQVATSGGLAATTLNAANEIAVDAFLTKKLRFDLIPDVIDATLQSLSIPSVDMNVEAIIAIDQQARSLAQKHVIEMQH